MREQYGACSQREGGAKGWTESAPCHSRERGRGAERQRGVGGGRRRKTGTVGRAGEGQKSKDTERLRKKEMEARGDQQKPTQKGHFDSLFL